ncbi:MAG: hypothetical protein Q8M22_01890 [Actinomycetota bacterium]|nr:hypothetical protein [Actinomycetota bacterium]
MIVRRLAACAAVAVLLAACGGDDGMGTVELYDRVPVPAVPDRTAPIDPAATTLVGDGAYWAELVDVDVDVDAAGEPAFMFDVSQALFAQACLDELGADGCPNDFGVVAEPHLLVTAPAGAVAGVTVAAENQRNFAITADELVRLVSGEEPSAAAPEGFAYVAFPYLLTVRDGTVVAASQIWVP